LCSQPTPQESSVRFVKRIVAGPGDTITIQNGHVIRNRQPEPEGYTRPCVISDNCTYSTPITVPAGYWYMLGDNRGQSDDSRFWGPVPKSWMLGPVVATYWPLDRLGVF
jgi:signal peptidase I